MENLLILITLISWYYFVILSILEKEDKEKIFYIVFITIVFVLLKIIIFILWIWFINYILYFIFLFLVHSLYTNFAIINRINEYLLKNAKEDDITLRSIIINLMNKELEILKKDLYSMTKNNIYAIDIIILTLWLIFIILLLLNAIGLLDIFEILNSITK